MNKWTCNIGLSSIIDSERGQRVIWEMLEIGWHDGQCGLGAITQKYLTAAIDHIPESRVMMSNGFWCQLADRMKGFYKVSGKNLAIFFCDIYFNKCKYRGIIRCAVILLLKSPFYFYPRDCVLWVNLRVWYWLLQNSFPYKCFSHYYG